MVSEPGTAPELQDGDIPDSVVGVTTNAKRKSRRFYTPDEARARVLGLLGELYLRRGNSAHDPPEFHLYDERDDYAIVFIVSEKPIILTQCHGHWDYDDHHDFVYIGRGV